MSPKHKQEEKEEHLQLKQMFHHKAKEPSSLWGRKLNPQPTPNFPSYRHCTQADAAPEHGGLASAESEERLSGQQPPPGQHHMTNPVAAGPQTHLSSHSLPSCPQVIGTRTWLQSQPCWQIVVMVCRAGWRDEEGTEGTVPRQALTIAADGITN